MTELRVNGERLWQSLMTMAEIGATPNGGVNRQTLTDEDRRGRDLFRRWCDEAGLHVSIDRMGSMFARRQGTDEDLPPVMLGSHLDSQPTGGKFDGALGVLAALEVVRTLNDRGIETKAPLEVVNWTNEEGCRFPPAMIASGVFAGVFDLEYGLSRQDHAGRTIGAELERIGYAGDRPVGHRPVSALFELHIEQGPILEAEGQRIGIVTGGQGTRWYDCEVIGAECHAGPSPMESRRDALRGAAALLEDIYQIAHRHAPSGRATVGEFQAYPGSRNTVPGRVRFTVDLRHPDGGTMDAMDHALREVFEQARGRAARQLDYRLEEIWYAPPVAFDPACIEAVRQATIRLGLSARDIVSGAGHDAVYMARVVPTAMIFVPCKDGISHAEIEYASPEACADGANVLLHAVLARAGA
ncbi:MAG TPA: Zn-dependent hydrolase [Geminicoccaceae bacterium]|nr:Zn-dependent hydrolase [Geminicoccaceae bacterium]